MRSLSDYLEAGRSNDLRERERVLAHGMRDFASELRLIDVVEWVTFIRTEKFAHIDNLVHSAAELCFKNGALTFASSADVHLDWGAAPTIWFDLEFKHRNVEVYFCLVLESCQAGVEINFMRFDGSNPGGAEDTQRLIEAIDDARERRPGVLLDSDTERWSGSLG